MLGQGTGKPLETSPQNGRERGRQMTHGSSRQEGPKQAPRPRHPHNLLWSPRMLGQKTSTPLETSPQNGRELGARGSRHE
eukprot:9410715-Pyramimonas_sp.AAC.1